MEIKLVINDVKTGKAFQRLLSNEEAKKLEGLKMGYTFKGELIGMEGYEFKITGGSDKQGFPMRADVNGTFKKKILLSGGVGYKPKQKGVRKRKSIRGNTIADDIAQVNARTEKYGNKELASYFEKKEKEEDKKKF